MTTPQFDYGTTAPADLPENVVHPTALGAVLQDTSEESYQAEAAARFPGALDGTLAGGPLASGPLGIVTRMATKLQANVANADPATIRKPGDLQPLVPGFFSLDLGSGIFGGLLQALQGVGSGVLGGVLGSIADFFSGRWDQADRHETDIQNLQDTTTDLSLATGHATAFMSVSPGTTTTSTRMPFDTQVGTRRGVTNLGDGRWRLDSAGEWDLSAQVEFWGGDLMPPGSYLEIVVRYPSWWPAAPSLSGTVYDGVRAIAQSSQNITVTNVTSCQVPAPGFTVEVRAWTDSIPIIGGSFRGIRGGYSTTRLRIRKFEMLKEAS